MPSIRSFLESHTPIPVSPGPEHGLVVIETDDLVELEELSGLKAEGITSTNDPFDLDHSVVPHVELQKLARAAHDAVHREEMAAQRLARAASETSDDGEDYGMRSTALHFATQIISLKIQAGGGLDSLTIDDEAVVKQAQTIYRFLKGN